MQLAPHCPLGPLALAACLQVGFATPNYLIQEQSIGIHYNEGADVLDYVLDTAPLHVRRRPHRAASPAPAWASRSTRQAVRAADKRGHAWRGPVWRHADGSFAEW